MRIENMPRASGKTTRLIYASWSTGDPILTVNESHKNDIKEMARNAGIDIPEPITVNDLLERRAAGSPSHNKVHIDEAPFVLEAILQHYGLQSNISTCTIP